MSGFKANVTPVFTRTWWEKTRPFKMRGSGMGKALALWEKSCPQVGPKLAEADDFKAAFEACRQLEEAIKSARKKAGSKDRDALAVMDKYDQKRKEYFGTLTTEYKVRVDKFTKDRKELLDFTKEAVKAMEQNLAEMQKYAKYLDDVEGELIEDVTTNAGVNAHRLYQEAGPAARRVEAIAKATKQRYEEDGVYIKERRGSKYNASSYGVLHADGERLAGIFNEATKNTNEASNLNSRIANLADEGETTYLNIVKWSVQGKQTMEQSLQDAQKLLAEAERMGKELSDEVYKAHTSVEKLQQLAEDKSPIPDEVASAPLHVQKIEANLQKARQIFDKLNGRCTKGLKRIPDEQRKSRQMKPHVDAIRMSLLQSTAAMKKFEKEIDDSRRNAKKLMKTK